ncbi:unnamed protein product [Aphanomyces euteiches]|uniref:Uncharacterized protein n=1 Tax=Aphanomyces euteiches TaxID=100861 RepID=A0A6G0WAZ9_9STRA|nr:hypothetical protein Ae201684_016996 [Aphanomyces euteiches]KAH9073769.1 hypothetical protein Ae201684P_003272 [Aphanomyces euteiches]KAH9158048.1 hypothetical protein AeRB84_000183 [Aphanomyces euteiches]
MAYSITPRRAHMTTDELKITAPSLLAFAKFKEREAMNSPTSPGMSKSAAATSMAARKDMTDAATAFRTNNQFDDEDNDTSDSDTPRDCKANTGRWTDAEHKLFLKGLECFPYRAWKKIATLIKTRSVVQIRTHAQKYYQKLAKEEAKGKDRNNADFMMTNAASSYAQHSPDMETRQKSANNTNVKKRKFSFDEGHYTRLPKRKETMLVNEPKSMDMMRPNPLADKARLHENLSKRRPVVAFDVPMIVEYPDDKQLDEYDDSLSRMTPVLDDDMLQLTDEDWFSSNSETKLDDDLLPEEMVSPSSSPRKKNAFMSVYHCDTSFDFEPEADPYSILFDDHVASTNTDEFILDPQTFLTCYFNKDSS